MRKTKFSAYFWSKKSATNVVPLYTWELEEQSRAALVELLIKQTRYMVKEVFINYGYLLGVGRDNVSEGLMSMSVVDGGVKYFLIECGYTTHVLGPTTMVYGWSLMSQSRLLYTLV